MVDGRTLFDSLRKGQAFPRPPLLPLVEQIAPRVSGKSAETLKADPVLWAGSVRQTSELIGSDALVMGFDHEIALAVVNSPREEMHLDPDLSGEFSLYLSALEGAFEPGRHKFGCIAAITGPITLAMEISGAAGKEELGRVKQPLTKMVEAICERRPDLLVFMESAKAVAIPVDGVARRAYATVKNVAAYYNVATAIYSEGWRESSTELDRLLPLGVDVLWLGKPAEPTAPTIAEIGDDVWAGCQAVVIPVGWEEPDQPNRVGQTILAANARRRGALMFSSAGPLGSQANIESLIKTKTAFHALTC